ncbi:MAG: MerR family transcriptional regulator [Paenibacillaceae bacterium]|nr:MerR family transcriptional regulator [Paenibacillaceae bacterium]
MPYTVKEVSELSHVTVKTLHHYHKIGLLLPSGVNEAGYRLYGAKELERLQEILFYKELDFPLAQIKELMERRSDRLTVLAQQEKLLLGRQQRLERIVRTLQASISSAKEEETMGSREMFAGFENEEEWNRALAGQNQYLQETYGMEPVEVVPANVPEMNEQAVEAMTFMNEIASSLRAGIKHDDAKITALIGRHLAFMSRHGNQLTAEDFAAQMRFFLSDDFHLHMLESQQIGLAYYLSAAAASYAAAKR